LLPSTSAKPHTHADRYFSRYETGNPTNSRSSAAVALDLDRGTIRNARIALGGVATVPWRARDAEQILTGEPINDAILNTAAEVAFRDAVARTDNAFKIELGKRTLVRALRETAAMEI